MQPEIKHIVILGGGAAGWLTAGILAAQQPSARHLRITLVESPDVKILGVGEGTWPTMRDTLRKMGVSELALIRECDVSFKQGTQFQSWIDGSKHDRYYHPFSLPNGFFEQLPARFWPTLSGRVRFAEAVSTQPVLCQHNRAPKQPQTPEFAAVANYGYHLDAVKFADFLRRHCVERLGVQHRIAHITDVRGDEQGFITALRAGEEEISGDLFVDCSGFQGQLIDQHYHIPFHDLRGVLFNDCAMVWQQPHDSEDSPLASATISTAQANGWIWDIALTTRRGLGLVYANDFQSDDEAEATLRAYIKSNFANAKADTITPRKIRFRPGHRQSFWHKNCVAIGTSAGFIEPLEASALVLIELSANQLSQQLPRTREQMAIIAKRFNETFLYRWQRITEFLKLHYLLSRRRDSEYWHAHQQPDSIPESLQENLLLWQHLPPSRFELPHSEEIFPAASYQYILYGMGLPEGRTPVEISTPSMQAEQYLKQNLELGQKQLQHLPSNRELLNLIRQSDSARQPIQSIS